MRSDRSTISAFSARFRVAGNGLAVATLLGLSLTLSSGCGGAESQAGAPAERPPSLVRVAPLEQRSVAPGITVVGSVIPRHKSVVASGANGIVEEFPVDTGIYVEEGRLLSKLRMRSTDLELKQARGVLAERKHELDQMEAGSRKQDIDEAKARLAAASAVMENLERRLERAQSLFDRKALNKEEVDNIRQQFAAARNEFLALEAVADRVQAGPRVEEIAQTRARYEAQLAQVDYLESEREKRLTLAPFGGYITQTHTYVGQWLEKGAPVVTLALMEIVDVVANVDPPDIRHIRLGETAKFTVDGIPGTWEGKIVQIIPRSNWESGARGMPVVVRLNNKFYEADGRRLPVLKEGMMAKVTFEGDATPILVGSKDALVRGSRGKSIYVFEPSDETPGTGVVRQVVVDLGLNEGTFLQYIGEGLAEGNWIVVEGAERLRPFETVRLLPGSAAAEGGQPQSGSGSAQTPPAVNHETPETEPETEPETDANQPPSETTGQIETPPTSQETKNAADPPTAQ